MKKSVLNLNLKSKIIICIIMSFVVVIFFGIFYNIIDNIKNHYYILKENINLINSIEDFSIESDNITISGYSFLINKNASDYSTQILLKSVNSGNEIWLNVKKIYRQDVAKHFNSDIANYDYSYSGFLANIKKNKLKDNEVYEIIIISDFVKNKTINNRIAVSSKKYILNNELYNYNPLDFEVPIIDNKTSLLYNIVNKGKLCYYNKDYGVYLYQYKEKLYWITTKDFAFDENGSTYVLYHLYTTQVERLPENRNEFGYDIKSFIFEKFEYENENTIRYRIATQEIPQEYAIAYIMTGLRDLKSNNLLWSEYIQIDNNISR